MNKVLIISPFFPPVNAADMHRVRQSVSYFKDFGWHPTVVAVAPHLTEGITDELLNRTLPDDLELHYIKAFSSKWTRRVGLGSLALRSLGYYLTFVNRLLKAGGYDLIYFSTTMFPVTILGAYWKKRFKVPYIIDMQDPWHTDYYLTRPKQERPAKFWFSYRLNKYLEPIAMRSVDGIISVSQGYCDTLQQRYRNIRTDNCRVIPFSAFHKDFEVMRDSRPSHSFFGHKSQTVNVLYVGRGGHDMYESVTIIFRALKLGLAEHPELFSKIRVYFIGTSYANGDKAKKTIEPVAVQEGVGAYVEEYPSRVPYFETLQLLKTADMLLIPGSNDPNYTASKLYPYIMAQKPLLAVFNRQSSVVRILSETKAGRVVAFDEFDTIEMHTQHLLEAWKEMLERLPYAPNTDWKAFEPYTAKEMTRQQVFFFKKIIANTSLSANPV